jgi:hypothetical protein
MADEPAKPRRLTVYAEAAAVLALVVAVVGVVVAIFAFEHDKEVAAGSSGATPVVTVTQYVQNGDNQESKNADSSSPDFWRAAGRVVLTILTGIISSFLVFMSWEALVSDFAPFLITVTIAGAHAFALYFAGITLIWAVILAITFAAIGFLFNVFDG